MDAIEDAVCNMRQYANPGNFAMIAKFRWDCENFAAIAKIRNHSEIVKFRKASEILLHSENHCA